MKLRHFEKLSDCHAWLTADIAVAMVIQSVVQSTPGSKTITQG